MATLARLMLCAWLVALPGCEESVRIARDFSDPGAGTGGANGGAGPTAGAPGVEAGAAPCVVTACQNKVYACGDCVDNDGDERIDAWDTECTGPCDDTEDSYFSGIPGANQAPCREDCYFDQDTGAGNDQCYWSQQCDPLALAPDYPPSGEARCAYDASTKTPGTTASCAELLSTQQPACLEICGPLTPNGCDGFGCCELPAGSNHFVWLGSTRQNIGSCSEATLMDPSACHPCTPVPAALNPCDACESCVGRPSLAPSCAGTSTRCPASVAPCGQPGEPGCSAGEYCVTGCCTPTPK